MNLAVPMDRMSLNPRQELRLLGHLWRLYRREQPALAHHSTIDEPGTRAPAREPEVQPHVSQAEKQGDGYQHRRITPHEE